MRKTLFVIISASLMLYSCGGKTESPANEEVEISAEDTDTIAEEKEFEMYEMSEMAALMEQMYVDNQRLKQRIIEGDTIGNFPKHFLNIHGSVMTDESERDVFFKDQAAKFLKAQELIYNDTLHAKEHFNDAVSACVKCHEQKCGGPIPRIKKLYIK